MALGPHNVAQVVVYRLRLRAGMHAAQRLPPVVLPAGPFFDAPTSLTKLPVSVVRRGASMYFGWFKVDREDAPLWHWNPFTGASASGSDREWWAIPDFDPELGDIKTVWEPSRFEWLIALAQQARGGDQQSFADLNAWLGDWCLKNQAYRGHNWKCGQEASIRVMHLAVAGLLLGQTRSSRPELLALLTAHLRRIAPTMEYAVAQENNHGTSEAAALFIGGSWLAINGIGNGEHWASIGRARLEERARHLIMRDGTFSQYSLNYHRLMLDTFSVAEVWRRELGLKPFSARTTARLGVATEWLRAFTDPATGDAPIIGANDGANLLPLTDVGYRDYRPAVQLAAALFLDARAFEDEGQWKGHLQWLGVSAPARVLPTTGDKLFGDGGFAVLKRGGATAMLRYPRFRFRPSHADALHVDLWVGGESLLRDGGSFSYSDVMWHSYFTGACGHNGVQFDDREQMPRLGRFLWGDWLRTLDVQPIVRDADGTTIAAAYRDNHEVVHERRVTLKESSLVVRDSVSGFSKRAVLRWRLRPGAWRLDGHTITDGGHSLTVDASVPIVRIEVVNGWESRFYLQRSEIPVVEIELERAGQLVSEYCWGK